MAIDADRSDPGRSGAVGHAVESLRTASPVEAVTGLAPLDLEARGFAVPGGGCHSAFAQLEFLDLAVFGARQIVEKLEKAGNREIWQPRLAKAHDVDLAHIAAGLAHQRRHHFVFREARANRKHRRRLQVGMAEADLLDFEPRNILAAAG